jgi:TRAP transporter 4TM/12TM fusion protein
MNRAKILILTTVCCAFSLFHIYTAYFGVLSGMRQRILHLTFTLFLTFWIYPFKSGSRSTLDRIVSGALLVLSVSACIHIFLLDPVLPMREGDIFPVDVYFGLITIAAVLEATRRVTGWQLPLIALLFLVYAYIGPYLPGLFGHRGFSIDRIVYVVYLTTEGIFGMPLYVSSTFIVLFIILAAFLKETGIGEFFIDIAFGMFGRVRGGPAKVAVVASSFFGTFSGSALANVTGTGTFTIPLMIRTGFSPQFAAAVEAVASTGGQFMPPIMASVAFVMAEILGISYIKVAIAASIPALLYYTGIFAQVDFRAAKRGLKGVPKEELPSVRKILVRNGHLLLPLVVLIYILGIKQLTPMRAAFWTIMCTILVSAVRRSTRLNVPKTLEALKSGAIGTLSVATACASIGIIVGVLMLTGLGLKLSGMLVDIAQGSLLILLVLSMVTSLILGMGVPTLAAYLVLALVVAPALINMGVKPIAAHLFMFYFGIISCITPPVALAAYTAAGISGSDPMKTGYQAVRLGIAAFIVPFLFVYHPVLLMEGPTWKILQSSLTAMIGVTALAASLEGYLLGQLPAILRVALLGSALTLIHPGAYSDLIGLALITLIIAAQLRRRGKWLPAIERKMEPERPKVSTLKP